MDIGEYLSKTINMYFGKVEEGYNYVNKNVGLWDSLIVYYFIALISIMISTLTDSRYYQQFGSKMIILIIGLFIFTLVMVPIGILIGYGLIHIFLKMFGGRGSFTDTIKFAIAASVFSGIVGTVISVATNLFMSNMQSIPLTIGLSLFMFFISLGLGIWALIVMTRTLSLAHKISPGKTLLAILMPAFILLALVFVIVFIITIIGIAVL